MLAGADGATFCCPGGCIGCDGGFDCGGYPWELMSWLFNPTVKKISCSITGISSLVLSTIWGCAII